VGPKQPVIVVGAGVAGLVAAQRLAHEGLAVTVLETAAGPGGKMRQLEAGGALVDSGPTVLTMLWVFEEIFAEAGAALSDFIALRKADTLARHAWGPEERLDLFADLERSCDAIGAFAGAREAQAYRAFSAEAEQIYMLLEAPFLRSACPSPLGFAARMGSAGLRLRPFTTLAKALAGHFRDPRLRQLFGRYATYSGASPYHAPATLMLIAHVERMGVWLVDGGMHALARALAALAARSGVTFRYGAQARSIEVEHNRVSAVTLAGGERLAAAAVVFNGDAAALSSGLLGAAARGAVPALPAARRSFSALTVSMLAKTSGVALARHNVFFSGNYRAEFDDLMLRRRLPAAPTVYVCAQDREAGALTEGALERLFLIINAPPDGDARTFTPAEIDACLNQSFALLRRCGLTIEQRAEATRVTTPSDFNQLFPATGGALYGMAPHGWMASFQRPGAASRLPGLYLAGGSAHPGAGVPMAALSGRLAAARVSADLRSTRL
jgi:1-hydroxycarotenoid 3,4-desaturase